MAPPEKDNTPTKPANVRTRIVRALGAVPTTATPTPRGDVVNGGHRCERQDDAVAVVDEGHLVLGGLLGVAVQSELHKAVVAVVHDEILLQTHEHSPEPPLQLRPVLRVAHRLEAAAQLREVQALRQVLGGEDEELASHALVGLAIGVPGLAMAFAQLGVPPA